MLKQYGNYGQGSSYYMCILFCVSDLVRMSELPWCTTFHLVFWRFSLFYLKICVV